MTLRITGIRRLAIAAACAVLPHAPASAADLGGDCCADLEERIAELEATTARKGNRKVSLTVSGYIARELTWWDDGIEQNVYIHDIGPTQTSNVRFNGKAQFAPGWEAGYMLRIQFLETNPFGLNQDNDNFSQGPNVQMSFWYIKNDSLGQLSVGKQVHAAKSAAMFTDKSGTQLVDNYTFLDGFPGFFLNSGGTRTAFTWGQMGFCYAQALPVGGDCNGIVMNGVRYDSPVFAGFTVSASWGEDDFWEVATRYSGELSGFKINLGIGYSQFTDENTTGALPALSKKDASFFQAGGYIEHIASGLFVHGAYGYADNSGMRIGPAQLVPPDADQWYAKAGLRKQWTPLGATIIYGDYASYEDQVGPALLAAGATSSTLRRYGGGIAQEIDAAAMLMYLKYQRYDGDVAGVAALTDIDKVDFVSMGAVINF